MASLAESLLKQISAAQPAAGGSTAASVDPTAQNGLAAAIPVLITALSRNAQSKEGAESLHQAIVKDHDGSVLDNLTGYLQNPALEEGDGILKHTLGDQRASVQSGLAQTTGLDMVTVSKLLQMAAPLVLGMLAKQQQQKQLDPDGLAEVLNDERKQEAASNPDMMKMVAGWLDLNDDGSFMDEVQGLAGRLFGRRND